MGEINMEKVTGIGGLTRRIIPTAGLPASMTTKAIRSNFGSLQK